ncbi:MAG: VCBS repeat-containing protein [Candidatus Brocadiia bacterium]
MPPLHFDKTLIADERYEAAAVFDVDNDGVPDIVSGTYWYPGPDFDRKCRVGDVAAHGEYFDQFAVIPLDVNGNGYVDFVTGGWFGNTVRWRENPKGEPDAEWPEHVIAEVGNVEAVLAWDLDGDGIVEIVPNTPGGPQRIYKLETDDQGRGQATFSEHVICDGPTGHGLGFGDINGNGRPDIVLHNGWLEAPDAGLDDEWVFHPEFDLGSASCPVIVADVNGDGLNDIIVGQSHGYGLDWWEQRLVDGRRTWHRHPIDPLNSQYHCLWWGDLDDDGEPELVTGTRYRAHCGHDPGAYDAVGIYYFKWTGEGFAKQVVDFGPPRQGTGCGIWFDVADVTGDERPDVIAPGKDGLYLFRNRGFAQPMGD